MQKAVMALDVGFAACGVAIFRDGELEACETIITEKTKQKNILVADDSVRRCSEIARRLHDLLMVHNIGCVVGELPHGGAQSANAMAMMRAALAIVATLVEITKVPAVWCTPNDVKKAWTGNLKASKDQIMELALAEYPGLPKAKKYLEHVADAIGAYKALKHSAIVRVIEQGS